MDERVLAANQNCDHEHEQCPTDLMPDGRPEKSRILHVGYCAFIWIASSIPDRPGISTSDINRSGDFALAAASASSGEVKNFAENPCICSMAARVEAMTG